MKYEYKTTFVSIAYQKEKKGIWIFKKDDIPYVPDQNSLLNSEEYQSHLSEMGVSGWDLVCVQPLLRGVYKYETGSGGGYGVGYPLTAGYYFFWKKEIAGTK